MEKYNPYWMTGGPWYNKYICKTLHGRVFEEFIRNARTDRYNLLCYIDAQEKNNPTEYSDGSSGGGYLIPFYSTTE